MVRLELNVGDATFGPDRRQPAKDPEDSIGSKAKPRLLAHSGPAEGASVKGQQAKPANGHPDEGRGLRRR